MSEDSAVSKHYYVRRQQCQYKLQVKLATLHIIFVENLLIYRISVKYIGITGESDISGGFNIIVNVLKAMGMFK